MSSCVTPNLFLYLVLCISLFPNPVSSRPVKTGAHLVQSYGSHSTTKNYEEGRYFEGDLAVSRELIEEFYGSKYAKVCEYRIKYVSD